MAKFIFILKDKNPAALTKAMFFSHVEHLRRYTEAGKLCLAGPLVGQDRVLQIIEAATQAAAEQIVKEDPYVNEKFYGSYEMYELQEANQTNNWLMDTPRVQKMLRNLPEK